MGNVSTRPRKTATAVTKAITAVTKPQTSTPDAAATLTENEAPNWHTVAYAGRAAVSKLLTQALRLSKEANEHSSGWAHRLISNAITSNETAGDDTQFEIADTACNVEAALQGVLSLADDPVVPVVRAKVEHAISILDAIGTFNGREIEAAIEVAPRADIEDEPQAPTVTIQDIRAWMVEADKKLELAFDAAESGDYVETLLGHICHSVIVEPLHTIQRDDLTQADAARIYESLFPLLACIEGAIHLGQDSILSPTLDAAFELLDAAQAALDPVNDAVKGLPAERASRASDSAAAGEDVAFEASGIESNAYCMVGEVIAIIQARLQAVDSDLLGGALRVVEHAHNELAAGVNARDLGMCEEASAPFACAIAVLEMTLREHDDVALFGALRLLELAKTSLDDAIAGAN